MSVGGKIKLALFLIVILTIVGFWYIGKKDKARVVITEQKKYAEIIRQDQELKSLVTKAMADSSRLANLDYKDLPSGFNLANVKTVSNSTSTLREYGLTIASIFSPLATERENEAKITLQALKEQNPALLQKLLTTKDIYDVIRAKLKQTKVPTGLVETHLQIINSLGNMSELLNKMRMIIDEPLAGLQSAQLYINELSVFYSSINSLDDYLKQAGLKFTEAEKIKIFINI